MWPTHFSFHSTMHFWALGNTDCIGTSRMRCRWTDVPGTWRRGRRQWMAWWMSVGSCGWLRDCTVKNKICEQKTAKKNSWRRLLLVWPIIQLYWVHQGRRAPTLVFLPSGRFTISDSSRMDKSAKHRDNFIHPIKSTANTAVLITNRQREVSSLRQGGGVQKSSERIVDRKGARLCKGGWWITTIASVQEVRFHS